MILTLVILCIAAAMLLMIAYMVYNDYKIQQEIDQKALIAKKKEIINETDELLLNVTQIPYSTKIIIVLQERVLDALKQILAVTPNAVSIKQRIQGLTEQIRTLRSSANSEPTFVPPNDTNTSLRMMKVLRRLRKIIRIEFNRGRMSQADLITEDKRLELMIYKIQFCNLMSHIDELKFEKQYGTMRGLIQGALTSITRINTDDKWMLSLREELERMLEELNQTVSAKQHKEMEMVKEQQKEEDEIDALFMPKKKW